MDNVGGRKCLKKNEYWSGYTLQPVALNCRVYFRLQAHAFSTLPLCGAYHSRVGDIPYHVSASIPYMIIFYHICYRHDAFL